MDTLGRPLRQVHGGRDPGHPVLSRLEAARMARIVPDTPIVEIAELAGVEIPTNCTAGNCGTCLVRLLSGQVDLPEELPPGLDDYIVAEGGILTCCLYPVGSCDIDVIPPL